MPKGERLVASRESLAGNGERPGSADSMTPRIMRGNPPNLNIMRHGATSRSGPRQLSEVIRRVGGKVCRNLRNFPDSHPSPWCVQVLDGLTPGRKGAARSTKIIDDLSRGISKPHPRLPGKPRREAPDHQSVRARGGFSVNGNRVHRRETDGSRSQRHGTSTGVVPRTC